jgi:hypothetical protein
MQRPLIKRHTVRTLILIGTGDFIGSILRYLLSGYVQQLSKGLQVPFGTLAVNVVGCSGRLSRGAGRSAQFHFRRNPWLSHRRNYRGIYHLLSIRQRNHDSAA